jgi:hypothetical protein
MPPVDESFTGFRTQIEDLQFEQQRKLHRQINTLFSERYDLISRLRKDDTQYYAMLNEDWYHAEREDEVGEKRALLS